jgi:putative tributyrin esterase
MAICELHYFSAALQKQTAANVILPESSSEPFPVLYLLHGLSDDHTIWTRRTSLERYVEGLPLIVVMPDGGRGFYTDAEKGFAYETALIRDLISFIDRTFRTRAEGAGRCIGGLSMGGYGALKLGLKHPDLFCSAVSHSGALNFGLSDRIDQQPEFVRILGDPSTRRRHSLYALAESVDRSLLPALRVDCGTEDGLIEDNREFHTLLTNLSLPHEYEEFSGGHNWAYWDVHVQEAIRFHAKHLGI